MRRRSFCNQASVLSTIALFTAGFLIRPLGVQLSRTSIADETRIEHTSNRRTRAAGSGGRRNGKSTRL
jgi:hypothetical protein